MAELNITNAISIAELDALDAAEKKEIDKIIISFNDLSPKEQINLFIALFDFAHKELPDDKNLNIFLVEKK